MIVTLVLPEPRRCVAPAAVVLPTPQWVLDVALDVLEGLLYLHMNGCIHGDLKVKAGEGGRGANPSSGAVPLAHAVFVRLGA